MLNGNGLHLACHRLGSAGSRAERNIHRFISISHAQANSSRHDSHPRSRLFPVPTLESGHRCDSFFSPARRSSPYRRTSTPRSATTVFAPDMLFPLAALAVSYGALNRLSHCSFNRTFPGLRELATWHPLPGWNGARPPILKLGMWFARTVNVDRASLGCVSECITDRQQQRASSAVGSLGPLLTVGGLLIGKARLYQSADDFNLRFSSGVCDYTSDAGQCCAKRGASLFHGR